MNRRLLFLLIGLAFAAAACTSQGLPSSYSDQDMRTERQFIAACEGALDDEDAPNYCQCAFYTIAAELSFEQFLELDEQLKDDPDSLSKEQRELFESVTTPCAFSADDVY